MKSVPPIEMFEPWRSYAADFNSMTDDQVEEETRRAEDALNKAEEWLEAVAAWKAAGKPRSSEWTT